MLSSVNENSERQSNPMPQPLYLYLSGSAFLVSFRDPNKQLLKVKYVYFLIVDLMCKKYTDFIFLEIEIISFIVKQCPLNFMFGNE